MIMPPSRCLHFNHTSNAVALFSLFIRSRSRFLFRGLNPTKWTIFRVRLLHLIVPLMRSVALRRLATLHYLPVWPNLLPVSVFPSGSDWRQTFSPEEAHLWGCRSCDLSQTPSQRRSLLSHESILLLTCVSSSSCYRGNARALSGPATVRSSGSYLIGQLFNHG